MKRVEFQKLAHERVAEAKALLAAKRWAGAYYLIGYAVECGLKSCILARLVDALEIIFEDKRFSEKCWTHNLIQLADLAGVREDLDVDCMADPDLLANWDVIKDWSESSRYARTGKARAVELYNAVTDNRHGVLPWIKGRW